jgi:hypothetical protein
MTKKNQDLEMMQGTAKIITAPVTDSITGQPLNMTGATIYYGVFTSKGAGSAVIEKSVGDGVVLVSEDGTNDAVQITLDAADTNDLLPGRYYHECRVTLSGKPEVVFEGRIRLKKSKTVS